MPFRARNVIPKNAYDAARGTAIRIAERSAQDALIIAGGTDANTIRDILHRLVMAANDLNSYRNVSGIVDYAKAQEGDQSYDLNVEITALLATINDTAQWIRDVFPRDGNGYLLLYKLVNDQFQPRTFTAAQTVQLATRLQSIADAVV